jgi:uncharacterized protein (TIGR04141 family)
MLPVVRDTSAVIDLVSEDELMVEPVGNTEQAEEPEDATVNQVSVYLLRPEVGSFRDALRREVGEPIPVRAETGLVGELYVARSTAASPRWLEFARSITNEPIEYQPPTRVSAVLFLERDGRRVALTFGYGRHLLRRDAIEPDYGLKVAAGLIDPEEIASLDARSVEATTIQVRRQSSRGVSPGGIGFNVAREMLRALAGRLTDPNLGARIVGADSVALTATLDVADLGQRLDQLHEAYADERYKENFGHIDRWSAIGPGPIRDGLDQQLLDVLAIRREKVLAGEDPDALPGRSPVLEAPEVIEWRASGFRTSREADGLTHAFPELDPYLESVRRAPTISDLTVNHSLELISDESNETIARWAIYGALNWELDLDGDVYVLAEGRWWKIDEGYRARIDGVIANIAEADLERPDFDPLEWEIDYNRRLASHLPGRALLDRELARFKHESGTVEACDVFTDRRQFVHVKPDASAALLSHLFAQGEVAARLFLMLPEFRDQLRGLLAAQPALAALVPEGRPDPREYEVVYGIVRRGTGPLGLGLPFFSRNHLVQVVSDLELLGYRVSMARIEERDGARPPDAGPLFKDEAEANRQARVVYRSTVRSRRRAAAAPAGTAVVR